MDSVSKCKALINKFVTALRADETQHAMSKDERARYIFKLNQAKAKLAKLEGSGKTVSSAPLGRNHRAVSQARVVQVAMTNNNGRLQDGVRAMCLSGDGVSFAWGVYSGSVKRALAGLSHGPCSCGARFHMHAL